MKIRRSVPSDNLNYPALISIGDSYGTGFYLAKGSNLFLVTARHVLINAKGLDLRAKTATVLSHAGEREDGDPIVLTIDCDKLTSEGALKVHAGSDLAAIRVGSLVTSKRGPTLELSSGIERAGSQLGGLVAFAETTCVTFDHVAISNDVYVYGFPKSIGLKDLEQIDASRPVVRKGIVAAKHFKNQHVILDAAVFPGNSGGPVVQMHRSSAGDAFRLIGVVVSVVPFDDRILSAGIRDARYGNSGYAVAEPMDRVFELLATIDERSPT